MREVSVTEAKAKLLQILDEVEAGETYRLTRHNRAIARIVPETQLRTEEVAMAVVAIRSIGRRSKPMSVEEMQGAQQGGSHPSYLDERRS